MVVQPAEKFLDGWRAGSGSGSAQLGYLAVARPADSVAPTADDHSARAAQLADLVQADLLAVSAPADAVVPPEDVHSARAAQLADSAQPDSAPSAPADSAAPMADDLAERDWSLQDVHSELAGCPGGSLAGSQLADCRVDPVWQQTVGSQVGSAGSPDVPCSVSPACPEAPASPSVALQAHCLDASCAFHGSPAVARDVLTEPPVALRKPAEAVAV